MNYPKIIGECVAFVPGVLLLLLQKHLEDEYGSTPIDSSVYLVYTALVVSSIKKTDLVKREKYDSYATYPIIDISQQGRDSGTHKRKILPANANGSHTCYRTTHYGHCCGVAVAQHLQQ